MMNVGTSKIGINRRHLKGDQQMDNSIAPNGVTAGLEVGTDGA
jgi:hypothetical protein